MNGQNTIINISKIVAINKENMKNPPRKILQNILHDNF